LKNEGLKNEGLKNEGLKNEGFKESKKGPAILLASNPFRTASC